MNIGPNSNHSLRFSGVHERVLDQFEAKQPAYEGEARDLFGERVKFSINRNPHFGGGTVEIAADHPEARSPEYFKGILRSMQLKFTGGKDIVDIRRIAPEPDATPARHQGDTFRRLPPESLN